MLISMYFLEEHGAQIINVTTLLLRYYVITTLLLTLPTSVSTAC